MDAGLVLVPGLWFHCLWYEELFVSSEPGRKEALNNDNWKSEFFVI